MGWREDVTFGTVRADHVIGGVPGAFPASFGRGKVFYVDGAVGSDGNSGEDPAKPCKTLESAYARTKTNRNDIIYLIPNSSGVTIAEAITWSKNYVHLIGLGAPIAFANRARLFHSVDAANIITVSGQGCYFANFYFSHGRGTGTNLTAFDITGSHNCFHNVHFAGPQNATEGAANNYALLTIAAQNLFFKNCTIGSNTIALSGTTPTLMEIGTGAARLRFDNCHFELYAADTDITVAEISAVDRYVIFNECLFHAMKNLSPVATPAQCLDIAANINGEVIARKCDFLGFTALADDTDRMFVTNDVNVDDARGEMVHHSASAVA